MTSEELERRLMMIELSILATSKNVLNIDEAAILLNRSTKTIRNRLKEIPHYYGGTGLVFKRDELEAWMCQVECKPLQIK